MQNLKKQKKINKTNNFKQELKKTIYIELQVLLDLVDCMNAKNLHKQSKKILKEVDEKAYIYTNIFNF